MALRLDQILTLLNDPQMLRSIVWGGFGMVTGSLLMLMVTRFGQSKPLRKCAMLSVLAHVLLAGYAGTVRIDSIITGPPQETVMTVATIEDIGEEQPGAGEEERPDQPWEKFADSSVPTPEAAELDQPLVPSENKVERMPADDAQAVAAEASLPRARFTEFASPQPAKIAAAAAVRPTQAAEATESIDAPAAMRRPEKSAAAPRQPELAPNATMVEVTPKPESRKVNRQGVPSKLLEQPTLPPQLADVLAVDTPAPALLALTDRAGRATSPAADDANTTDALGEEAADAAEMSNTNSGRSTSAAGGQAVQSLIDGSGVAGEVVASTAPPSLATVGQRAQAEEGHSPPELYQARTAPNRQAVTAARGGDTRTEGAVQAALAWLASVQSDDGRWDADQFGAGREGKVEGRDRKGAGADADNAVTGLALLAFLGAGHTHMSGEYQETVRDGLSFLIQSQGRDGNLGGGAATYAFMYCHGMSSFALSEAYGMTQDPRLARPVRRAVAFSLSAQHPSNGGWRYKAGDPQGDTSQLGWQLMALKSAELGGIDVPAKSREGMVRFIKSVASGRHGGLASYRPNEKVTPTMTAEALVCRQFLGMDRSNPASDEAGDYIMRELPGESTANFYYWYYGTLATFHLQGEHWQTWNKALKRTLLRLQRTEGEESGSWDPDPLYGKHGGRIYSTAMGALCLEVYYRYLPLYSQSPHAPLE
ncbi:MAG: hypothetical protein AB7O62_02125 [Pirellulales bacterium]